MKYLMILVTLVTFIGCGLGNSLGDGSGGSSNSKNQYGDATLDNPLLLVENGTYQTQDHISYYKTRLLEVGCSVRIEITKDIEDIVIYDGNHNPIDYKFEYNTYTFTTGSVDDKYDLVVKDYARTYFNIYADCIDDLSRK